MDKHYNTIYAAYGKILKNEERYNAIWEKILKEDPQISSKLKNSLNKLSNYDKPKKEIDSRWTHLDRVRQSYQMQYNDFIVVIGATFIFIA
ncbi:MAG: hypothetical protein GY750_01115 [Lentisphaerae bacterium]|nr:hypothetical protein [Lentisphaerota bacterium]MCP4100018.1 hypothetical protein [Lentisphaerota bacterium]